MHALQNSCKPDCSIALLRYPIKRKARSSFLPFRLWLKRRLLPNQQIFSQHPLKIWQSSYYPASTLLLLISMKILRPGTFSYWPYGRISALVGLFPQLYASFSSLSLFIHLRNAAVGSTSTCTCRSGRFVLIFKSTTENCGLRSVIGNWLTNFFWGMFSDIHRQHH